MPLSIFGIWSPRSSTTWSSCPGGTRTVVSPTSSSIPSLRNAGTIEIRSSGSTSSIVRSPPVVAASAAKLATSTCSGRMRCEPPPSRSTPLMRRMFEPIPSIDAPSPTRKWQRSWMCGSQAAWPTIVSPSASTAAMIAFSVAITDASSRNSRLPFEAVGAEVVGAVELDLDAELHEGVDVRVEPAAADHVAARRRHGRPARSARAAARRAGTRRGSRGRDRVRARSSSRDDVSTRSSFVPLHSTRRRGRRGARPSSRRRGCAARSSA